MKTINSSKIEVLRESYEQQVNTHEISFRDYIELEAQSGSNFFRFLFDEDFEQDFDTSLTDEHREEYERFLNKLQDYNIFYIEVEDEENTLVCRVEEKLETIKANTLENNSEDERTLFGFYTYDKNDLSLLDFIAISATDENNEEETFIALVTNFNESNYEEVEVPLHLENYVTRAYIEK